MGGSAASGAGVDPRVARSRRVIREAATTLFLRDGYATTTMDTIAETAGVSKRTVYNNFADKDALFREVVLGVSARAEGFAVEVAELLSDPDDLASDLARIARQLVAIATSPEVVAVRRLIIGEAHRFPDLAANYYRAAPGRTLATLTAAFADLSARGLLAIDDPELAAEHFSYLVMGAALDRAMFNTRDGARKSEPAAAAGVTAFLALYGR